jgi:hypothetical protein
MEIPSPSSSSLAPPPPVYRILFAAKRIPGTGNFTTSSRIANIVSALGYIVELVDYKSLKTSHIDVRTFDLVMVLHALHGYDVLVECIRQQVHVQLIFIM